MTTEAHERGVRDYSSDTLMAIARDLERNPDSRKKKSWEHGRLEAIKNELKRRRDAL